LSRTSEEDTTTGAPGKLCTEYVIENFSVGGQEKISYRVIKFHRFWPPDVIDN